MAREKADEAARAAKAAKRAAPPPTSTAAGQSEGPDPKRAKTSGSALPAGFFSKGNERDLGDEDENEGGDDPEQNGEDDAGPSTAPIQPAAPTGDAELDDFFDSLATPEDAPAATDSAYSITAKDGATKPKRTTYKEVLPGQASYEAAPVRNVMPTDEGEKEPTPEVEETPAQRKERLAREEREEIMARLEEEERAQ